MAFRMLKMPKSEARVYMWRGDRYLQQEPAVKQNKEILYSTVKR